MPDLRGTGRTTRMLEEVLRDGSETVVVVGHSSRFAVELMQMYYRLEDSDAHAYSAATMTVTRRDGRRIMFMGPDWNRMKGVARASVHVDHAARMILTVRQWDRLTKEVELLRARSR